METDSVQLKNAVCTEEYDMSTLGAVFKDIKSQLRVGFSEASVVSCPRICNMVAHCLAAHGAKLEAGTCETWLGQFPDFVNDRVAGYLFSTGI